MGKPSDPDISAAAVAFVPSRSPVAGSRARARRYRGGGWNPQLPADLANFFIGDRFPPGEPDIAADERPRVEERDPAPPSVSIVADEIAAVAQMQADGSADLWRVGHWT
jgi:hypothetical protein